MALNIMRFRFLASPLLALVLLIITSSFTSFGVVEANPRASPAKDESQTLPVTLNAETRRFIDSAGRERFFHGLNVIYKEFPFIPITDHFDPTLSFSQEDCEFFQQNGWNIIRFGFMWPGAEPVNGTYNQTYFDIAESIMEMASQYGIYALVDNHQDSLAQVFCGEGIPPWAAVTTGAAFPEPLHAPFPTNPETGFPYPEDCALFGWADYEFTYAAASAYQALYSNTDGLADSFGRYWAKVAELYLNASNVLAFELINEPFAGDIFKNPFLMAPEQADLHNLQPFYDRVAPYIRAVDPDRLIAFEPVTWSSILEHGELAIGFEHAPGGEEYASKSVLSFHDYSLPNFRINHGERGYLERRLDGAKNLSTGYLLSEFDTGGGDLDGTVATMDLCDELLISWIGWAYKPYYTVNGTCTGCTGGPFYSNGTVNTEITGLLSRTYAQAVAGSTISTSFNSTTYEFSLLFLLNKSISEPTEVYLNEAYHYPLGYSVVVTPSVSIKWSSPQTNMLFFEATALAVDSEPIEIKISPSN